MSYVSRFYDDDDHNEYDHLNVYSDEQDSIGSDEEQKELINANVNNPELHYESLSPKEAEKVFLEDLDQKKVLLWCHNCTQELYFKDPTVMKIVHHFRQGGTTYYTSGNCPTCKKSIWKHFRFI
jgi:hypothetical protein